MWSRMSSSSVVQYPSAARHDVISPARPGRRIRPTAAASVSHLLVSISSVPNTSGLYRLIQGAPAGRGIPAGGVAPPSNTPGILGRRALPAGRRAPESTPVQPIQATRAVRDLIGSVDILGGDVTPDSPRTSRCAAGTPAVGTAACRGCGDPSVVRDLGNKLVRGLFDAASVPKPGSCSGSSGCQDALGLDDDSGDNLRSDVEQARSQRAVSMRKWQEIQALLSSD